MRIESLHFKNITEGWELSETKFDDLNLLVGVSGAGKTQILKAIKRICASSKGSIPGAFKWSLKFNINGVPCQWEAETQSAKAGGSSEALGKHPSHIFISEVIYLDKDEIVRRDESGLYFKSSQIPKVDASKSLLDIFDEKEIFLISSELQKITLIQADTARHLLSPESLTRNPEEIAKEFSSVEDIRQSSYETAWKLFFSQTVCKDFFLKIKEIFQSAFPQVEDLMIEALRFDEKQFDPILFIKLKGIERLVFQFNISSGMLKTLFLISLANLSADDSVLLIDEFENSLGINCLDVATDQLFGTRTLQFLITSHHPYVINNIPMEYWKVVTRNGSTIKVLYPNDLNLGESKHKAFTQLINSDEYTEGVTF